MPAPPPRPLHVFLIRRTYDYPCGVHDSYPTGDDDDRISRSPRGGDIDTDVPAAALGLAYAENISCGRKARVIYHTCKTEGNVHQSPLTGSSL